MVLIPVQFQTLIQENFKYIEALVTINNIKMIDLRLDGKLTTDNFIPKKLKYVLTYALLQSQVGQGKMSIDVDTVGTTKNMAFGIKPATLPSYDFEVIADFSTGFHITHKMMIDSEELYTMVHKYDLVNNKDQTLIFLHEYKINIPKTSLLHILPEGTYFGHLFHTAERKMALKLDWSITPGAVWKLAFSDTWLVAGAK